MAGKLKINEIAQLTGLSASTVSRVLAGKANVSLLAKEKVFSHARQMGILRDMPARRLLMNSLLICAPPAAFTPHGDRYYYEVIQGIVTEVAHYEVHIKKCPLEVEQADISLFIEAIKQDGIDGIIIIGIDDDMLYRLAAQCNKPVVTINAKDKQMRLDCVAPDHHAIGYSAARYLIQHGHRSLLLFTDLRRETMMQRLDGFKRACYDHHIPFDEKTHLLVTRGYGEEQARKTFAHYLKHLAREQLPSAIIGGGEAIARAVIDTLAAEGLQVPDDISVLSLDHAHHPKDAQSQAISAVHMPSRELGTEAVYILHNRLMRNVGCRFNLLLQGSFYPSQSVADINWKRNGLYQPS